MSTRKEWTTERKRVCPREYVRPRESYKRALEQKKTEGKKEILAASSAGTKGKEKRKQNDSPPNQPQSPSRSSSSPRRCRWRRRRNRKREQGKRGKTSRPAPQHDVHVQPVQGLEDWGKCTCHVSIVVSRNGEKGKVKERCRRRRKDEFQGQRVRIRVVRKPEKK
jgi:hypothetical protein